MKNILMMSILGSVLALNLCLAAQEVSQPIEGTLDWIDGEAFIVAHRIYSVSSLAVIEDSSGRKLTLSTVPAGRGVQILMVKPNDLGAATVATRVIVMEPH
jgi:hypothetical protein